MTKAKAPSPSESHGLPRWVKILIGLSLIGFVGLAVSGIGLIAFLRSSSDPLFLEHPQPASTAEIEAIARINIPERARNIHAQSGGFQDRYIHVRFDIDPADLESFLGATRYTPIVSEGQDIPFQQSIEPDESWWQPRLAKTFLSGSGFVDGINQAVLVDTSNPDVYIVYVATFET